MTTASASECWESCKTSDHVELLHRFSGRNMIRSYSRSVTSASASNQLDATVRLYRSGRSGIRFAIKSYVPSRSTSNAFFKESSTYDYSSYVSVHCGVE